MAKRIIANTLLSLVLFSGGICLVILHWNHWIPFANFESTSLAAVIDLLWAYIGTPIGVILIATALWNSYFFRAASIVCLEKIQGKT